MPVMQLQAYACQTGSASSLFGTCVACCASTAELLCLDYQYDAARPGLSSLAVCRLSGSEGHTSLAGSRSSASQKDSWWSIPPSRLKLDIGEDGKAVKLGSGRPCSAAMMHIQCTPACCLHTQVM